MVWGLEPTHSSIPQPFMNNPFIETLYTSRVWRGACSKVAIRCFGPIALLSVLSLKV